LTWAPLAGLWCYVLATLAETAWPGAKAALVVLPAVGAYSGKVVLALVSFAMAASLGRGRLARETAAVWLPGSYVAALLASFPPITEALAQGLHLALP